MPRFVLMLRDNGFPTDLSPKEIEAIINRYRAWGQKARQNGGEKLKDGEGKVMTRAGVTDGPYAESKEVMGGFMTIDARDYEEAVRLCRDHPHLDFGSIEIRAVDSM